MKQQRELEILAPAGAREQLEAAVRCGADAVYLGAGTLNARRSAGNFDGDALREAVEYCHERGVHVHLALNTVVLEKELPEALRLAETACALGVDAVIVQDLGLAALLRRAAPTLPLHASTQMAVHNVAGAKLLEEMGFTRVVLAREMSREEIARVTAGTTLETEVFVHGALCMCVSGQCYMSSIIGERSGNRGLCAQPCRLPFYEKEKSRCGLSLKDLSIIEKLPDLRELGVTSVKIEGRMKRPEYVAAAVTACREARDGRAPDIGTLRAVFSRSGFTSGYYEGSLGAEMFGTRQKEDVTAATGVLDALAERYRRETPRIGLAMSFTLEADKPARLLLRDANGHEAACEAEEAPQPARDKPTTTALVEQSLSKLGGTPYFLEKLEAHIAPGLCMPVSQMNRMRRAAVEALARQRTSPPAKLFSMPTLPKAGATEQKAPRLRVRFATAEQAVKYKNDDFEFIILSVIEMKRYAAQVKTPGELERFCVELPRLDFSDGSALQADLRELYAHGVRHAEAGNLGGVYTAKQVGFTVHGGWALNVTNSAALEAAKALGCADICLSYELNLLDCKRIRGEAKRGIVAYGHLPLMVVRNCPARAESGCGGCTGTARLKDRLGNAFFVSCHGTRGVAEVYNHVPLHLADRLAELSGLDFITLSFTVESAEECGRVLEEYRAGTKRPGATRGLYYRNIM